MSLLSTPAYLDNIAFNDKNNEHYRVRSTNGMNVVSARNCVSTSHFAAATCHYCTITVCLLSLCRAQASHSRKISLFLKKKDIFFLLSEFIEESIIWTIISDTPCKKRKLNFFLSYLLSILHETFLFRASFNFRNVNLVRTSTLYIWILLYSLTTDWTLSVLCVDGHAWRSLYPVWYVSTFILLIILHY